jgi:hypothetical protein
MRVVKFRWNGLWGTIEDKQQVGIIAQELESIAPYAIQKSYNKLYPNGQETDVCEVNPQGVIFLLRNAVFELRAQLNKKKQELGL